MAKLNKLLVIGGTGFFGKSILDAFVRGRLIKFGIGEVIILARNVYKFRSDYPELMNNNVSLISGDICELEELPFADIVIHAASSTDKRDYLRDGIAQKANIERSTANYCKLAMKFHKKAKIVYCSSGAVYGLQRKELEKIPEDLEFGSVEDLAYEKRNYALGKRFSEGVIIKLGEEGLSVSIARCFSFYGKYLPRDQHFAFGNFLDRAERGEPIQVLARNPVYRSYMSADDLVDSLMVIALNSSTSAPIFNVGSDESILIHDLARNMADEYNVGLDCNEITDFENVDRYVPDVSKLKELMLKNNYLE